MEQVIIFENKSGGVSIVYPTQPSKDLKAEASKVVPEGVPYDIIDKSLISEDRTFRSAWRKNGEGVKIDISAAKEIAHSARRITRGDKFRPLDIQATIPAMSEEAEETRQVIRNEDAILQSSIDSETTPSGLKALMINSGLI